MNINGIYFSCPKGAILVGGNFSGKSSIIKKIKDSIGKNKKVNVDGVEKDFYFINSETLFDEAFEGTKSLLTLESKKIQEAVTRSTPQPATLFDGATLTAFESNLIIESNMRNINDILGTSLNLVNVPKVKTTDLVSVSQLIEFNGQQYNLDQASSGVKTLIALTLSSVGAAITDSVIAIDEIENFLHPEWIQITSSLIDGLINRRNILIIATHSPILLANLSKKHPEMISKVEWNATRNYGDVFTWDYANVKTLIKNELNNKSTYFGQAVGTLTDADADKYIKASLNQETCMMFFWNKPFFVEGPTEKIYLEQKHAKTFISAGGFHQFIVFKIILDSFEISAKFLMDKDILRDGITIHPYNDYVFNVLDVSSIHAVFRLGSDFDNYLSNTKLKSFEKVPNAIEKISTSPIDALGETFALEAFINL